MFVVMADCSVFACRGCALAVIAPSALGPPPWCFRCQRQEPLALVHRGDVSTPVVHVHDEPRLFGWLTPRRMLWIAAGAVAGGIAAQVVGLALR
jgi:hypothetical protein